MLPLRDDVLYLSLGEPNLWWDIVPLKGDGVRPLPAGPPIPNTALTAIAERAAEPDDPRLTIEPQIEIPVRAADYFGGVGPVLEAVLGSDRRAPRQSSCA